jgi:hypothetical protein
MWNYDYMITSYKKRGSDTIYNRRTYDPTLAGRKVYWHGDFAGPYTGDKDGNTHTKFNCTVKPLEKGVFKFNVYFEDLTETELNDLVFTLRLNGEGLHKIGKGKPLGMGSIKIDINTVKYRKYSLSGDEIKVSYKNDNALPNYMKEMKKDFAVKKILEYTKPLSEKEAALVAYPTNQGGDKIYEWFVENRRKSIQEPTIKETLPKLGENKIMTKY